MKYLNRLLFVLLSACIVTIGCLPPTTQVENSVTVDLSNETQQSIVNASDERRTDLLLDYLKSENATERYLAAHAMGSVQDDVALPALLEILTSDPSEEVRYQAAYAIGQIGDESAEADLVAAFGQQDTTSLNTPVRSAILESVGKIGSDASLENLATISTYKNTDDQLLLGQMRGLYRLGYRGKTSPKATAKVVSLLMDKDVPSSTRQLAAAYFARMRSLDLSEHLDTMTTLLSTESDDYVLMNVVSAIGRSARPEDLPAVYAMMSAGQDYRVRVNAIRSLSAYPFASYRDEVAKYINDDNEAVRLTAGSTIRSNATPDQSRYLFALTRQSTDDRVTASLLGGIMRAVPYYLANSRQRAANMAIKGIQDNSSPYVKTNYIEALAMDPANFQAVIDYGINADHVAPRSTSASLLPRMLVSDKYEQIFRTRAARAQIQSAVVDAMVDVFSGDDEGAMAAAASTLSDMDLPIAGDMTIAEAMRAAIPRLELPKEIETLYSIEGTLAKWNGEDYNPKEAEYNHPIDWSVLADISDSSRIYILTPKGRIELQLYPDHAPGSVANFLALAKSDYYDNNTIHRVAPNFVVQAGCPRGDGYGALDYSIRSEVGPVYYDDEGYIGMASAGKDTEGVQWFITHSPTPHLDGRYTIFGKVTDGMDVVHRLQIGDRIQDVRVIR